MRLDKYLGQSGVATRSEATKFIRARRVTVDGAVVRDPAQHIDPDTASVMLDGQPVVWREFTYVMLNKPTGYVSATEDRGPTVMELLPPQFVRMGLFPCGRLDIDTVGFLLVTNDGVLGHELLSPKHHVDKTYRFRCDPPIGEDQRKKLCEGVDIGDIVTAPADVVLTGELPACEGEITIRGKIPPDQAHVPRSGIGDHLSGADPLRRAFFGRIPLPRRVALSDIGGRGDPSPIRRTK